jgi:NAD(P)-dependent dehydrogenase (short-subunit alcohol dehydrogenase family)/acyl carrier protein
MNSRTLDFAAQVLEATDERGVDIVLNSLNGEFIPKSLSVLAKGGRFIEIGKLGIWSASQVAQIRPDVRYTSFDLSEIARERPSLIAEMLAEVAEHGESGRIRPLPFRAFPLKDAAKAFRYMAQGKHIGKIVIVVSEAASAPGDIRPDATYLITGGLGAIGLELARWLTSRGARSLALVGRSNPTDTARATLAELTAQGVAVRPIQVDVTSEADLRRAFTVIDAEMPPLAGVFHAAGVLDDAPIGELSWQRFADVLGPKVRGGWLLHELTRERALDHFVLFSSIASVLGNPGQSNYAAGNAFLDALAHYRRALGLRAVAVSWGMWAAGGMAVSAQRLAAIGGAAMPVATCLAALETVLRQQPVHTCVVDLNFATYAARMGLAATKGLLSRLLPAAAPPERGAPERSALRESLGAAVPGERPRIMLRHVQELAAKLMGFIPHQIALDQPLASQGLDSLTAVELCTKLGQDVGAELPVSLLFDYPTLTKIAAFVLDEVLGLTPTNEAAPERSASAEPMSGDDVLAEMEALLN